MSVWLVFGFALTPARKGVRVPLFSAAVRAQRLLGQWLAAPVAADARAASSVSDDCTGVASLRIPLVLVTTVKLAFTDYCAPGGLGRNTQLLESVMQRNCYSNEAVLI